ncbi:MAG: gamma-glutamylputrescine oxidase [Candidatus Pseudothioglobus sp.]|jgi:gamma-glutamylputrescine oxidase
MLGRRDGGDPHSGYKESWYYATAKGLIAHPVLQESIDVDVCVVGGGYTGLSAALELAERGFKVALLESNCIGAGASGRNGGVLGMGQRKDQGELEAMLGIDAAKQMWKIACDANQLVRDRVNRYQIDCDLTDGELHVAHKPRHLQALWTRQRHLADNYGYAGQRPVDRSEVADMLGVDSFYGGVLDRQAGHLHPLNLVLGLARAAVQSGATIYEQSQVESYQELDTERLVVNTATGQVNSRFLVLACNGYLGKLEPAAAKYQMPINNFILATEPLSDARARSINRDNVAVVDTRFVVNYFHNSADKRLIFGGGENYTPFFPKDIKGFVRKHMLKVYPQLDGVKIDYGWGGTLAITRRRMPNFGRLGPNVYWAQGYSGHGIAMANMGGKLVAEAIAGQAEGFDLFANIRHMPFPGGRWLRWPGLVAGMLFYAMLDRL